MRILLSLSMMLILGSAQAQEIDNSRVVTWLTQNAVGYSTLSAEQKAPIERVFGIFLNRLENWQAYSKYYDDLYSDPNFRKENPYFADPTKGPYIVFLEEGQKLTDLPPYEQLRGKTVEEVFGYKGDLRIMDDIGGEATRLTLVMPKRELNPEPTGSYNTVYHEFGHILHLSLMEPRELNALTKLYEATKKRDGFIDSYSAHSASEYFAQGLEAYLSETKGPKYEGSVRETTKEELRTKDPRLYYFVEEIINHG